MTSAFKFKRAKRMGSLGEYFFDELVRLKNEVEATGVEVIDLSVGDPDFGAPEEAVIELQKQAKQPSNHRYASYRGLPEYRAAIAKWYKESFRVQLDPQKEILGLIGSKSGMTHLPLVLVNPGDPVLLPDPCYVAYHAGVMIAEGKIHWMPLLEKNGYLPDLSAIPSDVAKAAKLMFLNYPNNPTTACATLDFFQEVVEFAKDNEVWIAHDAPYNFICFDQEKPLSFLQVPGAKDVGVEFHSFSKLFNMTGWRISFVSGNQDIIDALGTLKGNLDMGQFLPIQQAATRVLGQYRSYIPNNVEIYRKRRNVVLKGLEQLGWNVPASKATFFIWIPVPEDTDCWSFTCRILKEAGVLLTPGTGFGPHGEGYIRIALTVPENVLEQVIERLRENGFVYK